MGNLFCSESRIQRRFDLQAGNGVVVDEAKANRHLIVLQKNETSGNLASDHSSEEQKPVVLDQEVHLSDDHGEQSNSGSSGVMLENAFSLGPNSFQNRGNLNCPSPIILDLIDHDAYPGFNPHPYIHKELSEMGKGKTKPDETTGAFRKATNGKWVHAFCAEWSLESTFRRGQINPVQGMETLAKNKDTCCVCQRIYGAYIKCSYGNCQTTFHPSCARNACFHMTGGGKLPHKAYCEKHSLEQKSKVELERLRLLCERIVEREKLKRELAVFSHEILAAKRDHAARSLAVRNPFSPPQVSSDSATTSIKGHPDSNISGSEAIQRSDDVTIDSTASVKRRGKGPILMDTDQKTDDSATSKGRFSRKPTESQIFSGKTVPRKHWYSDA